VSPCVPQLPNHGHLEPAARTRATLFIVIEVQLLEFSRERVVS
jgi:hypothetical protein